MEPPILVSLRSFSFIAVVAVLAVAAWAISTSNRFTRLRNLIRESWSDVDVALKRRHDLIPNLVATVKAYAAHEQEVLDRVVEARNTAIASGRDMAAHLRDENELARQVRLLFARAEAYPELRSSEQYLNLQQELANTEDRIAAARRFYNANVREYNTLLSSVPACFIASMRGLGAEPFFEVEELDVRKTPELGGLG